MTRAEPLAPHVASNDENIIDTTDTEANHASHLRDAVTESVRNYLKELDKFISGIRSACTKAQVDYVLVNTAEPIEHVLSGYLLQRSFMNRR